MAVLFIVNSKNNVVTTYRPQKSMKLSIDMHNYVQKLHTLTSYNYV